MPFLPNFLGPLICLLVLLGFACRAYSDTGTLAQFQSEVASWVMGEINQAKAYWFGTKSDEKAEAKSGEKSD